LIGTLVLCCVAGSAAWGWAAVSRPNGKAIGWQSDIIAAHKVSLKEGRPLLVVFSADWCGYCKKLEKETFLERQTVEYINSKFVPVRLDFDAQRRIADILEVKSLPTTVILNSEADLLGTIVGYVKTEQYRKSLAAALDVEQSLRK
jgi:thioredoxin-related protein